MRNVLPVPAVTFFTSLVGFLSIAVVPDSMAAPVVQRRIQAQKAAQQQMAQQYQQQAIAQQQAQQVAAYKQAMAQRQAVVQQQVAYQRAAAEYLTYKQAMQQALAQRNAELQAAAQVKAMITQKKAVEAAAAQQVQMAVAQRMVAQKQATAVAAAKQAELNREIGQYADFLVKRKAALAAQGIQAQQIKTAQEMAQYDRYQQVRAAQAKAAVATKLQTQQAQMVMGAKLAQEVYKSQAEPLSPSGEAAEPETVVGIQELWQALDVSSTPWGQIIDNEIKVLTVAEYIDRFNKVGITIKKSPGYYVNVINSISEQDPASLEVPFMNLLSYAAIVDYDFDNGQNKDELARRVLGEENFKANRERLRRQ